MRLGFEDVTVAAGAADEAPAGAVGGAGTAEGADGDVPHPTLMKERPRRLSAMICIFIATKIGAQRRWSLREFAGIFQVLPKAAL